MEGGWNSIRIKEEHVKILNIIPITKEEQALSKDKGIEGLLNYLKENEISYFKRR